MSLFCVPQVYIPLTLVCTTRIFATLVGICDLYDATVVCVDTHTAGHGHGLE